MDIVCHRGRARIAPSAGSVGAIVIARVVVLEMMVRGELKGVLIALSFVTSIELHPQSCRRSLINVDSGVEGSIGQR
jgi:hypothetical protein